MGIRRNQLVHNASTMSCCGHTRNECSCYPKGEPQVIIDGVDLATVPEYSDVTFNEANLGPLQEVGDDLPQLTINFDNGHSFDDTGGFTPGPQHSNNPYSTEAQYRGAPRKVSSVSSITGTMSPEELDAENQRRINGQMMEIEDHLPLPEATIPEGRIPDNWSKRQSKELVRQSRHELDEDDVLPLPRMTFD
jgi:hypothetical protein